MIDLIEKKDTNQSQSRYWHLIDLLMSFNQSGSSI